MKITVGAYENQAINNGALWSTVNTTLTLRCGGWKGADGRIGGCDHFMKTSVKSIVDHYVRRVKREGLPGEHKVEIQMTTYRADRTKNPQDKTLTLNIVAA